MLKLALTAAIILLGFNLAKADKIPNLAGVEIINTPVLPAPKTDRQTCIDACADSTDNYLGDYTLLSKTQRDSWWFLYDNCEASLRCDLLELDLENLCPAKPATPTY